MAESVNNTGLLSSDQNNDAELERLLDENSDTQVKKQLVIFKKKISKYRAEEKVQESLRQKFVSDFTMQRIIHMTKEEYVVGHKSKDSFCYRLETELQDLGNIHGASANKFGLYYGNSGEDKTLKYRISKKFGSNPDEALEKIKEQIVRLRMAGEAKDFDAIRACEFGPMFRGKILSTFFPDDYLAIFTDEHLDYFLSRLGIRISSSEDILEKQKKLLSWKQHEPELKGQSNFLFIKFLYTSFGRPFDDEKDLKDRQKIRDEEYPKEFAETINITIDQWKELLRDNEVFRDKDLELLKRIYRSDNHATTCYDLAAQDGCNSSVYIMPVVALARRVSEIMGLEPKYGSNGKRTWWCIIFWGRIREDSHFEWKLQPKLARALQLLYPELDVEEANAKEDQSLVDDLKQATLTAAKESFEYTGQAREKAALMFTNGHKTYPRDRQMAINALAHAHYMCEIDENHPTFVRKNSDKNYTEPHHLIPMAFSDEFDVSLDVEENIVSLCSNCHNQIHYGKGAEKLLKKLYDERKDALKKTGINIVFKRLLSMYGIQSDEEE